MVGPLRPQPHARAVVPPPSPSRLLFLRHFQPFPSPDPLDPVLAHSPSGIPQQHRDPPIAIPSVLAPPPGRSLLRQGKFRHQPLQPTILFLQLLPPLRLVELQPAKLPSPAVVRLF